MGLLSDLYSGLNTYKRKVGDFVANPLDSLALGITRFGEDQHDVRNTFNNAYPMPGNNTVLNSQEQIKQFRREFAEHATQQAMAGMFGGVGAKTANTVTLDIAKRRLVNGENPAQVWRETGWGKGPDGKMRFEIPDNAATVQPKGVLERGVDREAISQGAPQSMPQWVYMNHDPLYAAYPELKRISIKPTSDISGGAYFDDASNTIGLSVFSDSPKASNLHELQHAIQKRERFAVGGQPGRMTITKTPDSPYPESLQPHIDEYRDIWRSLKGQDRPLRPSGLNERSADIDDFYDSVALVKDPATKAKLLDILNKIDIERQNLFGMNEGVIAKSKQIDAYRRLGGEAEARLVQSRMNMTPEQRSAQYPWERDYFKRETGVGIDDLDHRFDTTWEPPLFPDTTR